MTFALILVITAVASYALADVVRKVPWLFYLLAVAAVAVLFAGVYGLVEGAWWKPLILLVRRCMVALALFTVVMFIGVLPRDSRLGMRMRGARAELSIIACILCMGHMCMYLVPYAQRALSGTMQTNIMLSFAVAMVLFVLLLVLGVTSFHFVKRRMKTATWKRIQRLAYPFFLLTYAHLVFMLAPSALGGGSAAVVGVAVYTVVFVAYAVLRLVRYAKDRRETAVVEAVS